MTARRLERISESALLAVYESGPLAGTLSAYFENAAQVPGETPLRCIISVKPVEPRLPPPQARAPQRRVSPEGS